MLLVGSSSRISNSTTSIYKKPSFLTVFSDFAALWFCCSVALLLHAFVASCLCGFVALRLCGIAALWLCGFVALWFCVVIIVVVVK